MEKSEVLENDALDEINHLVETLTTSGQRTLCTNDKKRLKQLCRMSDGYIEHLHHRLLSQLEMQHAQIRFSTFQIIDEFFMRSHCFRNLVLNKFKEIMELCIEINKPNVSMKDRLLPKQTAEELIQFALKRLLIWHESFAAAYPKLSPGITYLRKSRRYDFSEIERTIDIEREAERMSSELLETQRQRNLSVLTIEINETIPDIELCVTQLENAIHLLLPPVDEFFSHSSPDPSPDPSSNTRVHGMVNLHGYSVEIDLSQPNLTVTEDNEDLFHTATEHYKLANKRYRGKLERWIKTLKNYKTESVILGKLEYLKKRLITQSEQYNKFTTQDKDDDTSDDDFEDVEDKEGYESGCETVFSQPKPSPMNSDHCGSSKVTLNSEFSKAKLSLPRQLTACSSSNLIKRAAETGAERDPTSMECNLNVISQEFSGMKQGSQVPASSTPSTSTSFSEDNLSRKKKLLSVAPVLPYSLDLHYWEEEKPVSSVLYRSDASHRFLKPNDPDDIFVPKGVAESLFTRRIEVSSQFDPVKRMCRYPLTEGKLCERMDRENCPFHGMIVDRDAAGQPTNLSDVAEMHRRQKQLEAKKLDESKKPKRKKYPNLTDIKTRNNTARRRLTKKVMNKRSLGRVSEALEAIDRRIKMEKFGHSFVSVLGSK